MATWDTVRIGEEDLKVAVVALHLKAFPTDARSCAQREGQAVVARQQIQDLSSMGVNPLLALYSALCLIQTCLIQIMLKS